MANGLGDQRGEFSQASLALPCQGLDEEGIKELRQEFEQFQRLLSQRRAQLDCVEVARIFERHPKLERVDMFPPAQYGVQLPTLFWAPGFEPPRESSEIRRRLADVARKIDQEATWFSGSALSAAARALDPQGEWHPAWLAHQEAIELGQASGQAKAASQRARV
jgi:hypothetical protein